MDKDDVMVADDPTLATEPSGDGAPELSEEGGGDDGESPEVIRKRLKDTQAKLTKVSQELAEMKKLATEIAEMKGKVDVLASVHGNRSGEQSQEAQSDPFGFLGEPDVREEILADPDKLIGALRKTAEVLMRGVVAVDAKLDRVMNELRERIESVADPVDENVKRALAEIESKPWAQKLSRREKLEIAKTMAGSGGQDGKTKGREYPGRLPQGGAGGLISGDEAGARVAKLLKMGGWTDEEK